MLKKKVSIGLWRPTPTKECIRKKKLKLFIHKISIIINSNRCYLILSISSTKKHDIGEKKNNTNKNQIVKKSIQSALPIAASGWQLASGRMRMS